MANYTTAEKVAVLLGWDNFSATTRPTLTQVNAIIADVTNEIDFNLAAVGITTQPTDSRILGRLDLCCKYGTAAQIGLAVISNADNTSGSQGATFKSWYDGILKEISDTPEMYGAISGDSSLYISNPIADGTITETEYDSQFVSTSYRH